MSLNWSVQRKYDRSDALNISYGRRLKEISIKVTTEFKVQVRVHERERKSQKKSWRKVALKSDLRITYQKVILKISAIQIVTECPRSEGEYCLVWNFHMNCARFQLYDQDDRIQIRGNIRVTVKKSSLWSSVSFLQTIRS